MSAVSLFNNACREQIGEQLGREQITVLLRGVSFFSKLKQSWQLPLNYGWERKNAISISLMNAKNIMFVYLNAKRTPKILCLSI